MCSRLRTGYGQPRTETANWNTVTSITGQADSPRVSLDLENSRQMMMRMRTRIAETLDAKNAVDTRGDLGELDNFGILSRVQSRLESMKSGKLKAALGVMDVAAKVGKHQVQRRD